MGPPTPRVTTTLRQSQAAPERFERADDAQRLAKRIETVLARRTSRLIVVLERLVDGHNYSAIFRTCEALGVQHVWVVAPPPGAARFESRSSLRRKAKAERARQYAANDANRRADDQPVRAGSRKDRRRQTAADAWTADDALDAVGSATPVAAPVGPLGTEGGGDEQPVADDTHGTLHEAHGLGLHAASLQADLRPLARRPPLPQTARLRLRPLACGGRRRTRRIPTQFLGLAHLSLTQS